MFLEQIPENLATRKYTILRYLEFQGRDIRVLGVHNLRACSIYIYHKVPKFSDARKLCCNQPNIQTKRPNCRVLCQKDDNGIANSEYPDLTAPL